MEDMVFSLLTFFFSKKKVRKRKYVDRLKPSIIS